MHYVQDVIQIVTHDPFYYADLSFRLFSFGLSPYQQMTSYRLNEEPSSLQTCSGILLI